jgi:hypothetical protein
MNLHHVHHIQHNLNSLIIISLTYINSLQDYTHKKFADFNDYICSHRVNNIHTLQL